MNEIFSVCTLTLTLALLVCWSSSLFPLLTGLPMAVAGAYNRLKSFYTIYLLYYTCSRSVRFSILQTIRLTGVSRLFVFKFDLSLLQGTLKMLLYFALLASPTLVSVVWPHLKDPGVWAQLSGSLVDYLSSWSASLTTDVVGETDLSTNPKEEGDVVEFKFDVKRTIAEFDHLKAKLKSFTDPNDFYRGRQGSRHGRYTGKSLLEVYRMTMHEWMNSPNLTLENISLDPLPRRVIYRERVEMLARMLNDQDIGGRRRR